MYMQNPRASSLLSILLTIVLQYLAVVSHSGNRKLLPDVGDHISGTTTPFDRTPKKRPQEGLSRALLMGALTMGTTGRSTLQAGTAPLHKMAAAVGRHDERGPRKPWRWSGGTGG
ncbi:hypothetical protein B0T11DRAFT_12987 [Plectosphaerella cucumerina]|uniref:Secreted protein n=1 Tax=Plectosphaerella cucumerina TaxID=40658 RepID=A0A8K0TSN6_9PEZI|nr:hypothetical protein B0T11DRAFT_12987 [Plectosphaerella cucumerina]